MERGSYLLLEPGMNVRGANGDDLGTIVEVVADAGVDIFRGMVVSHGLLAHDVFVPGEYLQAVDDVATLSLTRDELATMEAADSTR